MDKDLSNDRVFLLQEDLVEFISDSIGERPWTDVYHEDHGQLGRTTFFCALVPSNEVDESLRGPSWDLSIGHGMPGCNMAFRDGDEVVNYHRFGTPTGVEPFVFVRHFHDIRPPYVEISEEFRHFHDLYHDIDQGVFLKVLRDGSEEEVIRLEPDAVKVRTLALRQFLGIKEMYLAVFVDSVRYSKIPLHELDQDELDLELSESDLLLIRYVREADFLVSKEAASFSRLLGKKLISPIEKERSGIWPYSETEEREYASYIIGVDRDGGLVEFTCNPDELANYFGANPDAPHYLTPVFFRREVLNKYYSNPSKFTVSDSLIRCGTLWSLRIDNNLERHVAVFLGDLGTDIRYAEQLYWKSFNIPPEGSISNVYFRRSMLAQPADPESRDLLFRSRFRSVNSRWEAKYGWHLFLPLAEEDAHLFEALHIPVAEDQAEFDSQVLAFTKIVIDSINEGELVKQIQEIDPESKGITKLEAFLRQNQFPTTEQAVSFLRDVQGLRSAGVGHRKGRKYSRIAAKFELDERGLRSVFSSILDEALSLLDVLDRHFLERD